LTVKRVIAHLNWSSVSVTIVLSFVAVSSTWSSTVWTGWALCYVLTSQWNHVDRQSMSTCVLQPRRGRPVCINCCLSAVLLVVWPA